MQLDKFIVVYKDGGLPEVWNTYTYQEVYRNNPDHFKGYRILSTFNENSAPFDTASIEQEAERLYPYHPQNDEMYTDSMVTNIQRSAHITCARQYMGEIEKLKAEVERLKAFEVKANELLDEFRMAVMDEDWRKAIDDVQGIK